MRFVTWNLRNGAGWPLWPELQAELGADIVFLQEADQAPEGEGVVWTKVPGAKWGSAVITTHGSIRPIVVPGYDGWVVGGIIEGSGRPLAAFSLHAPSSTKSVARGTYAAEVATIIALIREAVPPDSDLVVGGDFNITLGERHTSESLKTSDGDRVALQAITAAGLVSCWTATHPDEPLRQTLRWAGDRSQGRTTPYHCDGILVPQEWSRWISCVIHAGTRFRLSDHNPVSATVTFPAVNSPNPA